LLKNNFMKTSTPNKPTGLKLDHINEMRGVNRGMADPSQSKRLYAVIAGLILFAGLLIYGSGLGCLHIGTISKARYEKSSGSLIRMFSKEDAGNYEKTKHIITLGHILQTLSTLVMFLGIVLLIKPELLYYEFKRWGIIRKPRAKVKT